VSFSFGIENKDIALKGSQINIVYGVKKLEQDIAIWLKERYRSDRFHSTYGSVLDNFIGGVIDSDTESMVQGEIMRVLRNYQSLQYRRLKENPQLMSADEVLVDVQNIKVQVQYDSVFVYIAFLTGNRTQGSVSIGLAS
jgi:hypothetical protein